MNSDQDLQELLWRYIEGVLTADEQLQVQQLLRDRPELGRILFQFADERMALREALGSQTDLARSENRSESSRRFSALKPYNTLRKYRERRGASWTGHAVVAAVATLVLVLAVTWLKNPTVVSPKAEYGRIETTNGDVKLERDGKHVVVARNTALQAADALTLSKNSTASFVYEDGTRVTLFADTQVKLIDENGAKRVQLQHGRLRASIVKQPFRKPMLFQARDAIATVIGTELSLAVTPFGDWLEVQKGNVRFVRDDKASVDVAAGQFAVAGPNIQMEAREVVRTPTNMALKRPATASSVFEKNGLVETPVSNGNDGDINTTWASRNNQIQPDPMAWWQVDLGVPCEINRLEIVARQDKFDQAPTRANMEVRASNNADGSNYVVLATHDGPPFQHKGNWQVTVKCNTAFRYLRVVQLKLDYSSFGEFRAFGRPWNGMEFNSPK